MVSPPESPSRLTFQFALPTEKPLTLKAFGKRYPLRRLGAEAKDGKDAGGPFEPVVHVAELEGPIPKTVHVLRVYGPPDEDGVSSLETLAIFTPDGPTRFGPEDLARGLMFLHPNLMVLTPEAASNVLGHISRDPNFETLVFTLKNLPHWNRIEKLRDEAGNLLRWENGKPRYQYCLADEITNLRGFVGKGVTVAVNNDPTLRSIRWNLTDGVSHRKLGPTTSATPSGYRYQMQDAGPKYGISAEVVSLTDDFQLTLKVTNSFIRHCSVFVSFLGGDHKTPIVLPDDIWTLLVEQSIAEVLKQFRDYTDTDFNFIFDHRHILQFLGVVGAESTFFGVPVAATSANFTFRLPTEQVDDTIGKVRLICGSLGRPSGNEWDPQAAWIGIGLTALIDLVIPTISLIATVGEESNTLFDSIFKDWTFLVPTLGKIALAVKDIVTSPERAGEDLEEFFIGLADELLSKVLDASDIAAKLAGYFGAEEVEEAIPILGWALKAAAIEATVAQLAQTVGEIAGSPRVVEFDLTITMDTHLTLIPVEKGGFPATAASYEVTAQYTDLTGYVYSADLQDPKTDKIEFIWKDMPVGGKVTFLVAFYSKEGWLVGKGASASIENRITPGKGELVVPPIPITELLYPLTSETTYHHQQILGFTAGARRWVQTSTAPSETVKNLGTGPGGHVLEELPAISLNSESGILGYCWRGSGENMPVIGTTEPLDGPVFTFQNISFGPTPDSAWMGTMAGYDSRPLPAYIRSGPRGPSEDSPGEPSQGFLFLDPVENDGFHLRGIKPVTEAGVPEDSPLRRFDQSQTLSWGRFPLQPTSLAVHSTGCVVAIQSGISKIQLLELPPAAVPTDKAPIARLISGPGSRPGLVDLPELVAIAPNQTIFVLESGNGRIQAFSRGGHPIKAFPELPTPYWIPLYREPGESKDVTFTSLSVEIKGYLYLLSYEDDGYEPHQFRLDIYTPTGGHLLRQRGVNVAALTVDLWRDLYTLNYRAFLGPGSRTEPTVSEWVPSTPKHTKGE